MDKEGGFSVRENEYKYVMREASLVRAVIIMWRYRQGA